MVDSQENEQEKSERKKEKMENKIKRRSQKSKEHSKNLVGNFPEITDKPIPPKNINDQLHVNLGQFTEEERDTALKKIKNRKAAGSKEIPTKI